MDNTHAARHHSTSVYNVLMHFHSFLIAAVTLFTCSNTCCLVSG